MKVTPLEIRQKTFEKAFRGLDKDEVQAFLTTLSQEWEKVMQETKELKIKFEASEKEVQKLREVESSLFKTLKTAEDTGANLIDQATKTAELHMKETQMKAEGLMNEAKSNAKELMEGAEDYARTTLEKMEVELRNLASTYRELENQKEILLDELARLSNDNLDKLKRTREKIKNFDVTDYLKKTKVDSFMASVKAGTPKQESMEAPKTEISEGDSSIQETEPDKIPELKDRETENKSQSFFDSI